MKEINVMANSEWRKIEKGYDEKGAYAVCPKCKKKCRYRSYSEDGWVCECVDCDEMMDED